MKLVRFAAAASVLALGLTALASSPATAESDGEQQFVVLFAQGTDSATARAAVEAAGRAAGTPVARIGRIDAEPGLRIVDAAGAPVAQRFTSFDHFA